MLRMFCPKRFDEICIGQFVSEAVATPDLQAEFRQRAEGLTFIPGQVLFSKGEAGVSVYLVRSGEVGLVLPLSSKRAIGFRVGAGAVIGLPAAFSNEAYSLTAFALKDTEVLAMTFMDFNAMLHSTPKLSLDILKILAAETRSARIAIAELGLIDQKLPGI